MINRYSNSNSERSLDGKEYITSPIYPEIPKSFSDIYTVATVGDRYDILAMNYYQDSRLWWVIPMSNPHLDLNSYTPTPGVELRIPTDLKEILTLFKKANSN